MTGFGRPEKGVYDAFKVGESPEGTLALRLMRDAGDGSGASSLREVDKPKFTSATFVRLDGSHLRGGDAFGFDDDLAYRAKERGSGVELERIHTDDGRDAPGSENDFKFGGGL